MSHFLGTWKLVSYEYETESGQKRYPFGQNVDGIIMYDANGYMAVQIMRNDRPNFANNDMFSGTDDEVRAAFEGLNSYYGTYSVDEAESTVTHHLLGASLPNRRGTDQVRQYSFEGDQLTLKAAPRLMQGETIVGKLIWQRLT